MTKPVRIQLSREKGFNLQEHSKSINGLSAVNVARPSKWGNPFKVEDYGWHRAVQNYRQYIKVKSLDLEKLRNKNLACFCKPDQPCHADILLEIANREEG